MFEKNVLIIWQPSVIFLAKKCIWAYFALQTPLFCQILRHLDHGYDYSNYFKKCIHKVLTLNGHLINTIDWNLNSKSAWRAHRSVVLRMFWVILIDLQIWPIGLRAHVHACAPYRHVFDLKYVFYYRPEQLLIVPMEITWEFPFFKKRSLSEYLH